MSDPGDREADAAAAPRGWQAVIDERLIERCERLLRAGIARRTPSLPTWTRPVKELLTPEAWNSGYLQVREYEPPAALRADLKECMPQALLRDLHRLVREERHIVLEVLPGAEKLNTRAELDSIRAAQQRPARQTIEPSTGLVRAWSTWQRAFREERWQPFLRDDEPRRKVVL